MSHNPERKEKNCLNCGTEVVGRYCHKCGQENVETKENFWSLTKHFVYDIFHFDGKFFHTLGYIFSKPGFVAKEYAQGKRTAYLHPIRMYLFASAVFFLVFFSTKTFNTGKHNTNENLSNRDRVELVDDLKKRLKANPADSFLLPRITLLLDTAKPVNLDSLGWRRELYKGMTVGSRYYASQPQYDSVQALLPASERDNWIQKMFIRQNFKSEAKYGDGDEGTRSFIEILMHRLPYMLFVSLPFFAGLLKLLYIRRRNFYYSDHAVFTLYHYIFSFILLLVGLGFGALQKATGWGGFDWLTGLLAVVWPVYLFLEMRRFYGQGFGKTLAKFIFLNILGFFFFVLLFAIFSLFSFFQA